MHISALSLTNAYVKNIGHLYKPRILISVHPECKRIVFADVTKAINSKRAVFAASIYGLGTET